MKPRYILALLLLLVAGLQSIKAQEAYTVFVEADSTLTFYYDTKQDSRPGTAFLITNGFTPSWNSIRGKVSKVVFDPSFANARPTTANCWFNMMKRLKSITGISYLNTSEVTSMREMFYECNALTSLDVSGFNTANVTTMSSMFAGCKVLTSLDVSNFNTANVTSMSGMFNKCNVLTGLDVSNFNTANVTNMSEMFRACQKLTSLDVSHFNTENVTNMLGMFASCYRLTSLDVSSFNTSNVTNMKEMFSDCHDLISLDVSSFNTENVTSMINMFSECSIIRRIYVGSGWNTDSVRYSDNMFRGARKLVGEKGTTYNSSYIDVTYAHIDGGTENPGYLSTVGTPLPNEAYAVLTEADSTLTFYYDLERDFRPGTSYSLNTENNIPEWRGRGSLQVSKVVFDPSFADARPTSTFNWFGGMKNLKSVTGISYLNTSEVTNMGGMFSLCHNLPRIDVSHFNTEKVTNMAGMFYECFKLDSLDVSNFSTENVTDMCYMFYNCPKLTSIDVSNFNTAGVTDMSKMFYFCWEIVSLDVSNFNTSNVTNMSYMFYECPKLTSLDLSHFNTAKVTDMEAMLYKCQSLKSLDLGSFNTSNVTNMKEMFYDCYLLKRIYVGSEWSTASVNSSTDMFLKCTNLIGEKGTFYDESHVDASYAHIDGGKDNPGYFADINSPLPYVVLSEADSTLTFYYDNQRASRPGYAFDLNMGKDIPRWYEYMKKVSTVVFDSSFAEVRPTSTYYWFYGMENLTSIIGFSYLNTSDVTDMGAMFFRCSGLTSLDVSNFNTENVTNMAGMFSYCSGLTSLDVSNFNTENVTDMSSMFSYCYGLTSLDLSNFNTANVTDMSSMFYVCSKLTHLDLSNFNTENVTNMSYMFSSCFALTGYDLSNFNTKNVTNMSQMFSYCRELTYHDLSGFNTANVTNMSGMFANCSSIERIYVSSGWSTAKVPKSEDMFQGCPKLVGQQRTAYNAIYVNASYAHLDEGTSNPGYLSMKWFAFEKDGIYYVYGWDNEAGQNGPGSNHVFVVPRDELYNTYSGDVVVPGTVTYNGRTYDVAAIMDESFKDCTELTSVTLPETSIGIEIKVFAGCTALQTVICTSTTPPYLTGNTFTEDHYQSVIVIVPTGTKATYQAADYWKNFLNIFEPSELNESIDYAGTIWQEYTSADGELSEANVSDITVTIAPSTETPGIVNLGYPAFTVPGANLPHKGFNVNGVNKYKKSDGTIYYALTEPKRMQIRGRTSTLLCDVTLVGVQPSPISMPVLKLILTGVRTQFEDVIWFGYGPDLDRIKALLEDVDDFITGVEAVGQQTTDNGQQNIYNLASQRLSKPQKGINIINGKKVLIK